MNGAEQPANVQRLRELAARAAAIEEQTRAALAGTLDTGAPADVPDPAELRFAVWRKKAEREFAARLAAALAERDNNADNPYRIAAAERLEALEESTRVGDELRLALEASEEKRCSLEARLEALTATCQERLAALDDSTAASEELRIRAETLARVCDERLRALEESARGAAALHAEIERLEAENAQLAHRAAELQRVCDERLAALEALHVEYAAVAKEAATRAELIEQFRPHAPAPG